MLFGEFLNGGSVHCQVGIHFPITLLIMAEHMMAYIIVAGSRVAIDWPETGKIEVYFFWFQFRVGTLTISTYWVAGKCHVDGYERIVDTSLVQHHEHDVTGVFRFHRVDYETGCETVHWVCWLLGHRKNSN